MPFLQLGELVLGAKAFVQLPALGLRKKPSKPNSVSKIKQTMQAKGNSPIPSI